MTINFSQNPENIYQQSNFGASPIVAPEAPPQLDMMKGMGLPSTADEFVKFTPFFLGAFGLSKFISNLAGYAARLNPLKSKKSISAAESFEKSALGRMTAKIDAKILPLLNKYSKQISGAKQIISNYTPNWVKNIIENIKLGVTPKNGMALSQYKGMTVMSADSLVGLLDKLTPEKLESLHLSDISGKIAAKKITSTAAVEEISKRLARVPAKDLMSVVTKNGGKIKLLEELNKSRAFIASNAKTTLSKTAQKGFMAVSEAAGGGVIGGSVFGLIMNSIFLASTLKRTWNAPWGEKLSTFMEGALVDFCGGYLMALLGTRITYKLLGIKNADKTAAQVKDIKNMLETVKTAKANRKVVSSLLKCCEKGDLTPELLEQALKAGVKPEALTSTASIKTALKKLYEGKYSAMSINSTIDKIANAQKFQKATGKAGFIKNLINRPLSWIGNFFSVGLETLPAKIADGKNVSVLKAFWQNSKNVFKHIAGYPVRFLLVLMVVTPPLTKLCAKVSHTLFGKPTKSIMEDENNQKNDVPKEQTPYHVGMNDFSNYTKASGMAKMLAGQVKVPDLSKKTDVTPELISSAVNLQKKKMDDNLKNISPATYIPSSKPAKLIDDNLLASVNQSLLQGQKLEQYVAKKLQQN